MDGFIERILGVPQGSPSLMEALAINKQDRIKRNQERIADDYEIPWTRTKYGGTDAYSVLQDWFNRAQLEREEELNRTIPTQQELDYGIPSQGIGQIPQDQPQVMGAMDIGSIPQPIYDYATGYRYSPGGEFGISRLNDQTLGILWNEIENTYPDLDQGTKEMLLANLVAVAQAESGMGGAYGNPEASNYKNSNYWNWFKGGNRGYDPESFEVMAQDIVPGIGGYTIGTGGRFTRDNASTYTGNDNLSFWYDQIYNPAMRAMGY